MNTPIPRIEPEDPTTALRAEIDRLTRRNQELTDIHMDAEMACAEWRNKYFQLLDRSQANYPNHIVIDHNSINVTTK